MLPEDGIDAPLLLMAVQPFEIFPVIIPVETDILRINPV